MWQRNLGAYLDRISALFSAMTLVCRTAGRNDATYAPGGQPLYAYSLTSRSVRIWPFPSSSEATVRQRWRIVRQAVGGADLTYAFLPSFKGLAAAMSARRARKPYALYIGSDWREVAPYVLPSERARIALPVLRPLVAQCERFAVRHAAFTIAHARPVVMRYGGPRRRVYDASPMLNWGLNEFREAVDTCRGTTRRLLYVGNFTIRKGIDDLLVALRYCRDKDARWELSLAGMGSPQDEARLQTLADKLKIADAVRFPGYQTDPTALRSLYGEADILVLPTHGEGFPRVIYEAMSQSVPVVATAIPTIAAVLANRQDACLVPPGNPRSLAETILEVADNPSLRRGMIRLGQARARKIFSSSAEQQFLDLAAQWIPALFSDAIGTV